MSICIFGVPSPQTSLAALYARFLSSLAFPDKPIHRINASDINAIKNGISNRPNDGFVFTASTPNQDIIDFAVSHNIPIAISIPPMRLALTSMMNTQGASLDQAIKRASYSIATLSPLIKSKQGLTLPPISEQDSVVPMISALARGLSYKVPSMNIAPLLKRVAGNDATRNQLTLLAQIQRHLPTIVPDSGELQAIFKLPEDDTDAVKIESLAPIFDSGLSAEIGNRVVEWPVNLAQSEKNDDGVIDLTGKARTLTALPPLHLPMGCWRAAIELSIDGNLSGNFLILQAIKGKRTIASGGIILPQNGRYSAEIEFKISTPREPIVIRIDMKFGAIEGTLKILRLALILDSSETNSINSTGI